MSDEVSQFLEQVERLRGQQIEEDEVRAKELEDYLAAKRERQARREERARSISPQKSSPANTPSPRANRRSLHRSSDALRLDSPQSRSREASIDSDADLESMTSAPASTSPTKENQSPFDADAKRGSTSARGSPLAWQRRPTSRGGTRPLSMVAAQNATQRSLAGTQEQHPASATEPSFSKDQIAQALGSKDPAWFRQTADRGQSSAAYRRSQVEDDDRLDMASVKAQLPGMSAESTRASEPSSPPATSRLASPLPLNPPRFDGPREDKDSKDAESPSPTGRASPARTPSPTKGMGGFVQSAMMKRSDSVKRWSVTSPPGLTRADSIASSRGPYDRSSALAGSRPQSVIREKSTTPSSSRPTSRHGEPQPEIDTAPSTKRVPSDTSVGEASTPKTEEPEAKIPTSPSKTMDPRRWSPTKASWLETALNKPESPKPQSKPGTPTQPSWMADLNKNKTGEGSGRPVSMSHRHQVSIGGLMRSSPMGGGAKPNSTGLGGIYSPPPGGNRPLPGHSVKLSISKISISPEPEAEAEAEPTEQAEELSKMEESQEPVKKSSPTGPPPVTKPKPETPPKKDFRSTLRQRAAEPTAGKSEEPEFKNVFGNLRRTKTQNYVAPDTLKDNIARGKAALNVTGGPKRTERVDEFKEAILKKKDDFKQAQAEGKGVIRSSTTAGPKPLPEGLARRQELGKPVGFSRRDPSSEAKLAAPKKPESPKPSPKPRNISGQPLSPPASSTKSPESEGLKRTATEPVDASLAPETRSMPALQKETSAPSRLQQGRGGSGKLADRFNSNLAGMLARGPPPMATNGGKKSEDSAQTTSGSAGGSSEPTAPGPQLTHMTKNRARGPRRKAPTSSAAPAVTKEKSVPNVEPSQPTPSVASPTLNRDQASEVSTFSTPADDKPASSFSVQQQVAAKAALRGKPPPVKPAAYSPELADQSSRPKPLSTRRLPSQPEKPAEREVSPIRPHKTGDAASQPGSPKKLDVKRMSRFLDEPADAKIEGPKEPVKLTHQRTGSRSPVKHFERSLPEPTPSSPTKVDSEPVESVGSAAARFGDSAAKSPPIKPKPAFEKSSVASTPSRIQGARALPIPPTDGAKSPARVESPSRSPTKAGNDISTLFQDFFGSDRPRKDYRVDPAEILMNRPQAGAKVKSSGVQMFQISGDGKKLPMPTHNEHVLFEKEMYICSHDFTSAAGKKTFEVYFWIGDEVAESAADDAQLFASREARSVGGRLIKLRQGKESSEFIQALGGAIITRRGSSTKHDSLAPSMLCGRRYLEGVAFDEVDFSPASLCAGFPYLITKNGACCLWKGKGCDVDELSCAKLIGMDLALMGVLNEVDDGAETDAFWGLFDGGKKPHSADHWRLKPNYGKYGSRLFCSDADSRQQIYEVHPFNQADLTTSSIYILDAFFEIYIIVGSRAQSQYASFRNALDFAQEYAILASGMEDRPFVPYSTVVLEGIPRDLRSVFRKWDDAKSPTTVAGPGAGGQSGGLKRGRSLRVVPLTQALQAFAE
ncbi:hypothetical protein LIA77_04730 [Sarocladium implicatum]|nr:hypothetical protein LIA77_04730 [Sarocladium implicatum]